MTIAHEASTGVDGASSPLGTTSSVTPYVGVAAGRRALLMVAVQPNTATFGTDPAGWTKLGERAGGADPHPVPGVSSNSNKIGVWYRDLDGSETGNVTVTNTGGDSNAGCMSVYSTTATWGSLTFTPGDDNAHGNDRSLVADSWTIGAGDVVVAAFSSDRAATTAITSPAFTQSGATFGTVTNRNKRISNNSNDCGCNTFDAAVSAGSTGTITLAYTQTATQCGPAIAIRLREAAGAATNVSAGCAAATGTAHGATFTLPSAPAGPRIVATSPRGRITTSTPSRTTTTSPRGWL